MTSEDEIKRIWQRLENLSEDVHGNGATGGVAAYLQRVADGLEGVRQDVLGVKEEVRGMKMYQRDQNGAVNAIKLQLATELGARMERDKWEKKTAGNLKWTIVASFTGAGILSSIIFGILNLVVHGSP